MKRNVGMLILFLVLGWLVGALIAQALEPVQSLSFLTTSTQIEWSPQADFNIISYDFTIQFKLCLLSLFCMIISVWLYRKL
ncbi:DUF4321 domain-containing protein [Paenibacillus crassostreae]|uniref:DUF4321 domain-containing protein n=1 Tax=Paenibacillus crassostreae TaxID=1763538 RepID=A0A167EEG3_9BACL|nr:DUF4321 domain-containing protein [Paenibacillus crassostreae]AOZ91913.1 hypothetical protein LPB68_06560 [Paenibacillus crassostreae]OAB75456.1 hypothetical protein PNBC_08835 [Paenibacillus crassostreae]